MSDEKFGSEEHKPGSLELTEELIRERAYQIYEQRGCGEGQELDDWLQAESEIFGKKPSESTPAAREQASRAAAA